MDEVKKPYKCGLIMPIAAIDNCTVGHWEAVRLIISESLEDTEFEVGLVSDSNEIGIIQKRIVQNTFSNQMVICDVSAKNPNVMFELGMRLAFDKPVVIIKDDFTNYSFDTGMIEHLNYPRDLNYHAIQNFKKLLKIKVEETFKASGRSDYTSFLSSFPTVIASKVPEKEVAGLDYLLESMSEIREEIRILSNLKSASLKRQDRQIFSLNNFVGFVAESYRRGIPDFPDVNDSAFRNVYNMYLARDFPGRVIGGDEYEEDLKSAFLAFKNYDGKLNIIRAV